MTTSFDSLASLQSSATPQTTTVTPFTSVQSSTASVSVPASQHAPSRSLSFISKDVSYVLSYGTGPAKHADMCSLHVFSPCSRMLYFFHSETIVACALQASANISQAAGALCLAIVVPMAVLNAAVKRKQPQPLGSMQVSCLAIALGRL